MSITLKMLNSKQEVASYNNTADAVHIQAQNGVNYQLIDNATGLGPQNVITKRVGNNLEIYLEDGDNNVDFIIENYYEFVGADSSNLLVGQYSDGQIYAYVPESGQGVEAVTQLADQVIAPQALGGNPLPAAAFWDFHPGWWAVPGALLVGGIVAAAAGGGGSGSADNTARLEEAAEKAVNALIDAERELNEILKAARADGAINETEHTNIKNALDKLDAAKKAAQDAVDALPTGNVKDTQQARIDNQLNDARNQSNEEQAQKTEVTDAGTSNGVLDVLDEAKTKVEAAQAKQQAAEKALADAQAEADKYGFITPEQAETIANLNAEIEAAKQAAQQALKSAAEKLEELKELYANDADVLNNSQALYDQLVKNESEIDGVHLPTVDPTKAVEAAEAAEQAAKAFIEEALIGNLSDEDKAEITKARQSAEQAQRDADKAADTAAEKQAEAEKAEKALEQAEEEKAIAEKAKSTAEQALSDAQVAKEKAETELAKVTARAEKSQTAENDAKNELDTAKAGGDAAAIAKAQKAYETAKALNESNQAAKETAKNNVTKADQKITDATAKVTDAVKAVEEATHQVNNAQTEADKAKKEAGKAAEEATQLQKQADDKQDAADALANEKTATVELTPEQSAKLAEMNADIDAAKQTAKDALTKAKELGYQPAEGTLDDLINREENVDNVALESGLAKASDLVAKAEAAEKAAEARLAEILKDGVVSTDDLREIRELNKAVNDAKQAASDAIESLEQDKFADNINALNTRLNEVNPVDEPMVNDYDNDGVNDAEKAEQLVEAAEAKAKDVAKMIEEAKADDKITPEEEAAIAAAQDELAQLVGDAEQAVNGLNDEAFGDESDNKEKPTLAQRLDALPEAEDVVADAQGILKELADKLAAAEDALADANKDGLLSGDEVAELSTLQGEIAALREQAASAVKGDPALEKALDAIKTKEGKDNIEFSVDDVNDADSDGLDDNADATNEAYAAVEKAERLEKAADKLAEKLAADGVVDDADVKALEAAIKAAETARAEAQEKVDSLPTSVGKDNLNKRLADIDNTDTLTPNDTDNNGIPDTIQFALEKAQEAYENATGTLKKATENGLVTPAELNEVQSANNALEKAKAAVQAQIDALPETATKLKAYLVEELAKLKPVDEPAVNDKTGNGIEDSEEAARSALDDYEKALKNGDEDAIKAAKDALDQALEDVKDDTTKAALAAEKEVVEAEQAYKDAEKALNDAKQGGYSADEIKALEDAAKKAKAELDEAKEAVENLGEDNPEKQALQDRVNKISDPAIDLASLKEDPFATAADLVKKAEDAYAQLQKDLAAASDDGFTTEEVNALNEQQQAAQALKAEADKAVKALTPETQAKGALQDRVDALQDISLPQASNEANAKQAISDLADALKAAEAALTEALKDDLINPNEGKTLDELKQNVEAARQAAQQAVDDVADKATQAALQAELNAVVTETTEPKGVENIDYKVNDKDDDGVDDVKQAQDLVTEAENKARDAQKAIEKAQADGSLTPEEREEVAKAIEEAEAAKQAAQDALNELLTDPADKGTKDVLTKRLNDIVDPEIDPRLAAESKIAELAEKLTEAEEALNAANGDGLISTDEKTALEALQREVDALRQEAKEAIADIEKTDPTTAAALTDKLAEVVTKETAPAGEENITVPETVKDENNDGLIDSSIDPSALTPEEKAEQDKVKAAEEAVEKAQIANQELQNALDEIAQNGGAINTEKAEALAKLAADAEALKDDARKAVEALPESKGKDDFHDALDSLDNTAPAANDVKPEDGIADDAADKARQALDDYKTALNGGDEQAITDAKAKLNDALAELPENKPADAPLKDELSAEASVAEAVAEDKAAKQALTAAQGDGKFTPEEVAELATAAKAAAEKKAEAENAVAALPNSETKDALAAELKPLDGIKVPEVTPTAEVEAKIAELAEKLNEAEAALNKANEDGLISEAERTALQALKDEVDTLRGQIQDEINGLKEKGANVADLQTALDNVVTDEVDPKGLRNISVPEVNDTDKNGLKDSDEQPVKDLLDKAQEAEEIIQEKLAEIAEKGGLVSEDDAKVLKDAANKLDALKEQIGEAIKALEPQTAPGVQDHKDTLAALMDTSDLPTETNDKGGNGVKDEDDAHIQALIKDAEAEVDKAKAALEQAKEDGVITPAENTALAVAQQKAQDAIDALTAAIDALPEGKGKQAYKDELENKLAKDGALDNIAVPQADDTNTNGVPDAIDDKVAALLNEAKQAIADAKALEDDDENDLITPEEQQAIQAKLDEAAQKLAEAQIALNDAPPSDGKDAHQAAIDAITVPKAPAVTDADNNGIHDVEDKVIAAEKAAKALDAAQDKLRDAEIAAAKDPANADAAKKLANEKEAVADAKTAATKAETAAKEAVDALPAEDKALQDRLQDRLKDLNGNGLADDAEEAAEKLLEAAEKAGRDYYNALNDSTKTPKELKALKDTMDNAEKAAKEAIDALTPIAGKEAAGKAAINALKDRLADLDGNKEPDDVQDLITDAINAENALKAALADPKLDVEQDGLTQAEAKALNDAQVAARDKAKADALKAINDAKDAGKLTDAQAKDLTDKVNALNTELPLEKPTIDEVAADGTVTGKATPGSTVVLKDANGNPLSEPVTVKNDGTYSIKPNKELAGQEIHVASTDPDDAKKGTTTSESLQMLDKPVLKLDGFDDTYGEDTTTHNNHAGDNKDFYTKDKEFTLTSSKERPADVKGKFQISTDGTNWKDADADQVLSKDGDYWYREVWTQGNQSQASEAIKVTLDTEIQKPTITTAENNIVSGTAEAGSVVHLAVTKYENNGYAVNFTYSQVVGKDGEYRFENVTELENGYERIDVKAVDKAGNFAYAHKDEVNITEVGARFYGYNIDGTSHDTESQGNALDGTLYVALPEEGTKAVLTYGTEDGQKFGLEPGMINSNNYTYEKKLKNNFVDEAQANKVFDHLNEHYISAGTNTVTFTRNATSTLEDETQNVNSFNITFGDWNADKLPAEKGKDNLIEGGSISGNTVTIAKNSVAGFTDTTGTKPVLSGMATTNEDQVIADKVYNGEASYDYWAILNRPVTGQIRMSLKDSENDPSKIIVSMENSTAGDSSAYITYTDAAGQSQQVHVYMKKDGNLERGGSTNDPYPNAFTVKGFEWIDARTFSIDKSILLENSDVIAYAANNIPAAGGMTPIKDIYTYDGRTHAEIDTTTNNDGSVSITPNDYEKMIIEYTPEAVTKLTNTYFKDNKGTIRTELDAQDKMSETATITATKANGTWTLSETVKGITINGDGVVNFEANAVADGTTISVKESETSKKTITANAPTDTATTAAETSIYILDGRHSHAQLGAGTVGSVNISSGANNNNRMVIQFTPEKADDPITLTFIRKGNAGKDNWYVLLDDSSDNARTMPISYLNGYELGTNSKGEMITLGGTTYKGDKWVLSGNNIHIPADALKDGSTISAWESNGIGLGVKAKNVLNDTGKGLVDWKVPEEIKTTTDDIPKIVTNNDGSVVVTAAQNNTSLTITYYDETGSVKGAEGMSGTTVRFDDTSTKFPDNTPAWTRWHDERIGGTQLKTLNLQKQNGSWAFITGENGETATSIKDDVSGNTITVNSATGEVTFHYDTIMGNTKISAMGVSGNGAVGEAEADVKVDAPTNLPITNLTGWNNLNALQSNVLEVTKWVKYQTDGMKNNESWVILPKEFNTTHSVRNILNYTIEYISKKTNEASMLRFEVRPHNGDKPDYDKTDGAWYIYDGKGDRNDDSSWTLLSSQENENKGWLSYRDLITIPGSYMKDIKDGSYVNLWTQDERVGGKWQLLDSFTMGEGGNATNNDVTAESNSYEGQTAGVRWGNHWLRDYFDGTEANFRDVGGMINMKGDGMTTELSYVDVRYLQRFNSHGNGDSGKLFIKGDANDFVNIGYDNWTTEVNHTDNTVQNGVWQKVAGGEKTYDGVTYDQWTHTTTSANVWIDQTVQVV